MLLSTDHKVSDTTWRLNDNLSKSLRRMLLSPYGKRRKRLREGKTLAVGHPSGLSKSGLLTQTGWAPQLGLSPAAHQLLRVSVFQGGDRLAWSNSDL